MVQFRPFRYQTPQRSPTHLHLQSAVREGYPKNMPLSLRYAFSSLSLGGCVPPISCALSPGCALHQLVMFGFEVGRADVFRAVRVLAEMTQEVYGVTPHGAVSNGVAVADTYLHGCPILSNIERNCGYSGATWDIALLSTAFRLGCRKG